MGKTTEIAWTDHTFNPWWGCTKVSPGCEHCYAETFSKRLGKDIWGSNSERRFFGDKHWNEPLRWHLDALKANTRRRVFCASMADVFEDRADLDAQRERLFLLIRDTPMLDWLLLTKRPENVIPLLNRCADGVMSRGPRPVYGTAAKAIEWMEEWVAGRPPLNVWLGTTVEDQRRAIERIPRLLRLPAAVRFLSCEPLLEPLVLDHIDADTAGYDMCQINALSGRQTDMGRPCEDVPRIDWIIVGGESGGHSRPFDLSWARSIRDQAKAAGAAFFMKQMGANPVVSSNGGTATAHPDLARITKKGGRMDEWPDDLRIQQFPTSRSR